MSGTNCIIKSLPVPSLRTPELTANLAALIARVVPFFHDAHRVSVHAPTVAQLSTESDPADDREQSAGNTGGNKSEMNVHEIYSD